MSDGVAGGQMFAIPGSRCLRLPGLELVPRTDVSMVSLRGRADCKAFRAAFTEVLGVAPPAPLSVVSAGAGDLLWLGPGEWLLVSADRSPPDVVAQLEPLPGSGGAVVDMSSARQPVRVRGARTLDLLERECDLDLASADFSSGRCTSTRLGPFDVLLHRVDDAPTVDIYFGRSFAASAWHWLTHHATALTGW